MRRLVVIAAVCALSGTAAAATVRGVVFLDRDGDGVRDPDEAPLPGVRVAFETWAFATTGDDGGFALDVPDGLDGIVWASVPEVGRPGPAWATIARASDATRADVAVRPAVAPASRRWRFVVATDAHMGGDAPMWGPADLAAALAQATDLPSPPRFVTFLGDTTQKNQPADFAAADAGLAALAAPWVPVPGNHDWYDGGPAYRAAWGPDSYSFTTGGVHVVVWNSQLYPEDVVGFVRRDLAGLDPSLTVVALGHIPPRDDVAEQLRALGVDYLFDGHWHADRVVRRGSMLEVTTPTLLTGGIDFSPAGYRVVDVADGVLAIHDHEVLAAPVLGLAWPAADRCLGPDGTLLVTAAAGAGLAAVTARIDGRAVPLAPAGGWGWAGVFAGLADGAHAVTLGVQGWRGPLATRTATVRVCRGGQPADPRPWSGGAWPQAQGDAAHHGVAAAPLAPPLATAWVAAVGGHLRLGAPAVADGRVFVAVADHADGQDSAVVALDLATGARRWTAPIAGQLHHGPAVSGDTVIVATTDATVRGLDAATGAPRWSVDLAAGFDRTETALWAPPTVADGVVYVGHQHLLVALDAATGHERWRADPGEPGNTSGSASAAGVAGADVVAAFDRNSGLVAWRLPDPTPRWRSDPLTTVGIDAGIVIDGDAVYAGDGMGTMMAFDRATGAVRWWTSLVPAGDWAYAIVGTPALAAGRLFVPTQWGSLVALDTATGGELWRYEARRGPLRTAHTLGEQAGFQASPVVAGDRVWIADTSGRLVALDVTTGAVAWQTDLATPVLGGLAVAGDALVVAGWDGTVRALAPAARLTVSAPPPTARAGLATELALPGLALLATALALAALRRAGASSGSRATPARGSPRR